MEKCITDKKKYCLTILNLLIIYINHNKENTVRNLKCYWN